MQSLDMINLKRFKQVELVVKTTLVLKLIKGMYTLYMINFKWFKQVEPL